jgi:DNA-binding NarL/FixJ family response regulator
MAPPEGIPLDASGNMARRQVDRHAIAGNGDGFSLSGNSVLIFDIDVAGTHRAAVVARCRDLRLVDLIRGAPGDDPRQARGARVSAVLVLHALTPSRVRSCARAVREGSGSLPAERLCQMLAGPQMEDDDRAAGGLTDREFDVLRLLADGDSTRDIAKRLSYSERTVKHVVHDLLVKLNCRTRAHAVALAARRGMI